MSLWTPYAAPEADAPLDLSKLKIEPPESPESGYSAPEASSGPSSLDGYTSYQEPYLPMPPPMHETASTPISCCQYMYPPPPYPPYPYAVPVAMSSIQISPVSVGSSRSERELQSPPVPVYRPPTLSPPESLPKRPGPEGELSDDPDFLTFERNALSAMAEKNGGTLLGHNPRMRRVVQTTQAVDDSYRKQRERNNFAAKQSRDRRKLRELHLALKVTYLKGQVDKLKAQLETAACTNCGNSLRKY